MWLVQYSPAEIRSCRARVERLKSTGAFPTCFLNPRKHERESLMVPADRTMPSSLCPLYSSAGRLAFSLIYVVRLLRYPSSFPGWWIRSGIPVNFSIGSVWLTSTESVASSAVSLFMCGFLMKEGR